MSTVKQNTTIAFKVLQCNEKETKPGNYITKIHREVTVETPFGIKKANETYYIAGTKAIDKDTMIPHSHIFPLMRIEEHPAINPATGEEFMAKWLHVA